MQSETLAATAERAVARLHLWVAWLCGLVLCLEGYDIAAVGYAVPSLVDASRVPPSGFTQALAAGNVGLLLGSLCARLLGDRLGRKPALLSCVAIFGTFSLLSAFARSELTQWYRARTAGAKSAVRKTMIVALARKLLIALWRYVRTGEAPRRAILRAATA